MPHGSTRRWRTVRHYVLDRDGYRCRVPLEDGTVCGRFAPLRPVLDEHGRTLVPAGQADHIIERHRGGTDDPANLRASCRRCNASRGATFGNRLRRGTPSRTW